MFTLDRSNVIWTFRLLVLTLLGMSMASVVTDHITQAITEFVMSMVLWLVARNERL